MTVINKLKRHFSVHGIPQKLYSDNGTQYTSQAFARSWDFQHVTSSPEYPQSNGLSERAVRSARRLLETTERDGKDFYLNLLGTRNMPRDNILGSPAQRLLSRRTRTILPICKQLLKPAARTPTSMKAQLTKKRRTQKHDYEKTNKPLHPLEPDQVVSLQTQRGHDKVGVVKRRCDEPLSYVVDSEGKEYRRNRRHILPVMEPQPPKSTTYTDELNTTGYTLDPDMDKIQRTEGAEQTPAEQCHRQRNPEKSPTSVSQQGVGSGRASRPNRKYRN